MQGIPLIELRVDVAATETYFLASSTVAGESEGSKVLRIRSGRYLDRVEKRGGTWRISNRTVIQDWSKAFDISAAEAAAPSFRAGQQGTDDFVYSLLGSLPA